MRTAEQLAKPSNIAFCAINVAAMHQLSFNPQAALAVAGTAAELGRAHGVTQLARALDVYGGWAVAASGNPPEGADRIRRGIAGWLADGGRLPHAWYLSLLGWSYALEGRFEVAGEAMEDAAAAIGELHMEEPIVAWTRADISAHGSGQTAALGDGGALRSIPRMPRRCESSSCDRPSAWPVVKRRGRRAEALELLAPIQIPSPRARTPSI